MLWLAGVLTYRAWVVGMRDSPFGEWTEVSDLGDGRDVTSGGDAPEAHKHRRYISAVGAV